ncbi:MAG TPA: transglycosylase SLT domain-containing protein [Drouetiella sp.]|jgi:Transglycosylase SLT domain
MRHHQFNPQQFDGESRGFDHSRHHQTGWHIELGNMDIQQSSQYQRMYMGQVHRHFHPALPSIEIQGGYEPPPQYYPRRAYEPTPQSYPQPYYGSTETNYYGSRPDQGQLEFTNPYQTHHTHHHHRHHHSHHHQYQPGGQDYANMPPGDGRNNQRQSIYTYDGAIRSNPEQAMESARIVAQVARRMGVDPVVAVAAMLVESGGNPRAVGDHGHSFGLFQLNSRGELAQHHLTPNQAFDPVTNAQVALSYFQRGHVNNPGAVAAAAQRPADRADYARKVNSNMAEAAQMVRAMGLA